MKRCPCGKTPEKLDILDGPSYRWHYVTGTCCGEWHIEFEVPYLADPEDKKALAEHAWNNAPRGEPLTEGEG